MGRLLFSTTLFAILLSPLPAFARDGQVIPRFEELRGEWTKHRPLKRIRPFFSPQFLRAYREILDYDWLDASVGAIANPAQLIERIQGDRACLAYALPYHAEAPGNWVDLKQLSYSRINGQWKITAWTESTSPVYHAIKSEDLCTELGWPWPEEK
jgi:hypothetical protein